MSVCVRVCPRARVCVCVYTHTHIYIYIYRCDCSAAATCSSSTSTTYSSPCAQRAQNAPLGIASLLPAFGASNGSGRLNTPNGERQGHWLRSHCLRCSRIFERAASKSIRPRCLGTQVYLMPTTTGRVGVLPHASALVSGARLWQMSLPADGEQKATLADRPSSAI